MRQKANRSGTVARVNIDKKSIGVICGALLLSMGVSWAVWKLGGGQGGFTCNAAVAKSGLSEPASGNSVMHGDLRGTNRLAKQRSLYLRQHGKNPIEWYPWGKEALFRSKREDKPIFLSIGYASCHWCHVMEKEVFEHEDVAQFMNAHFINIKVDREERPDLDKVYMEALQKLRGSGGWPMSLFLTPDLKPFYGGSYFPKPQFLKVTKWIDEIFHQQRDKVNQQANQLSAAIIKEPAVGDTKSLPTRSQYEQAVKQALSDFDPTWGGFKGRQKFPTTSRWQFLLHSYRKTGNADVAAAVRKTLDMMASGGMNDQIGGGFHRYTVEQTWLVPHFEKMLYDNAQLANLYVEAATVFKSDAYRRVAEDTLQFMMRVMRGDEGAFYASLDADSGGDEGSYYVWSPQQIERIADKDTAALMAILSVTQKGNFEGHTILTRRADLAALSQKLGRPESELFTLFERYRAKMRSVRNQRVKPSLDRKVVTSWNGLAIQALANAARVFGVDAYTAAAKSAADYLLRVHVNADGSLSRSSNDGRVNGEAILDDYAFLSRGLIAVYEATGEVAYLHRAKALVEYARAHFLHPSSCFYFISDVVDAPLGRQLELTDWARPSGNAVMLDVLIRLSALTADETYRQIGRRCLMAQKDRIGQVGESMSATLDAAALYWGPFYEVVIAGDPKAAATAALKQVAWRALYPHTVTVQVAADGPRAEVLRALPSTAGKTAINARPTAYVCKFGSCKRPTQSAAKLADQVLTGWIH